MNGLADQTLNHHRRLYNRMIAYGQLSIAMIFISLFCYSPGICQTDETAPLTISQITITGNSFYTQDVLLKELPFAAGTIYSRPMILEGKYYLSNYYLDNGYRFIQINSEIIPEENTSHCSLIYQINEGPRMRIGNIHLSGNTKTRSNVITRELVIKTGNIYRRKDLYISHNRLLSMNYFEEVTLEEGTVDSTQNTIDIDIKVTERKTGLLSFGGGFSTEEGIRGYARYRQSNLWGEGKQFSTGLKWAENGDLYQRSREIRMDYYDPHWLDTEIGLGMESYYQRENLDNYDILRIGGGVSLSRQILDTHTHGNIKFRIENDKVFNVINVYDTYMKSINNTQTLLTMISMNLTRDTRDNITYPTRGQLYSVDFGVSSKLLGSDINFVKLQTDGRLYIPLYASKLVLALRVGAGIADPYGGDKDIPIFERLYAGGADSVRGFKEHYLGPKDADGYPAGGKANLIYNAELRFPIYRSLGGVAFYDAGNVWTHIKDFDPTDIHNAVGLGFRYQTPIGPLRFDYAIELPRQGSGRFHISVGQTF